jgi:hypothetical protein
MMYRNDAPTRSGFALLDVETAELHMSGDTEVLWALRSAPQTGTDRPQG